MMKRLLIAAILCGALAWPAGAKQDDERLEALFDGLATAEDPIAAKPFEAKIWQLWAESGSATVELLMNSGMAATNAGEFDRARQIFDTVVMLAPDFAEGWNKRATMWFMAGDYPASVADIERTLKLEPRHFGALSGLGMIMERIDNPGQALKAWQRALAVHPHIHGARERVEALSRKVKGQGI